MQSALLFELNGGEQDWLAHIDLDERNAGWLLAAPGMEALTAASNDLRDELNRQHTIGRRFESHREFSEQLIRLNQPYENMERGIIPDDAVMPAKAVGIRFYYIPELRAIDMYGLTDYTVARAPAIHKSNSERRMAHDRRPPPGYLKERGANIIVHRAVRTAEQALAIAQYAVQVGPDLWMPFDSHDAQWVFSRFSGQTIHSNELGLAKTHPIAPNQFLHPDSSLSIERFIGDFESGMNGWRIEGDAVTNYADFELYYLQASIKGNIGTGFLTTYHPTDGDIPTGSATSPKFTAETDQHLAFLIAGGTGDGVGARLLSGDEEVAVWRGQDTGQFRRVIYPLAKHAGKTLQLQLFDNETSAWGYIMLDHVVILE